MIVSSIHLTFFFTVHNNPHKLLNRSLNIIQIFLIDLNRAIIICRRRWIDFRFSGRLVQKLNQCRYIIFWFQFLLVLGNPINKICQWRELNLCLFLFFVFLKVVCIWNCLHLFVHTLEHLIDHLVDLFMCGFEATFMRVNKLFDVSSALPHILIYIFLCLVFHSGELLDTG